MSAKPLLAFALFTTLTAGFMPALHAAYAEGNFQLGIISSLDDGTEIEGKFAELVHDGVSIEQGFTPATFTLIGGEEYSVGVADFDDYYFDYWLDTGSTDRWRQVMISENTELVAVYKIQTPVESEEITPLSETNIGDDLEESTAISTTGGGGNGNVYAIFYAPIIGMLSEYDLKDIPEAETPINYFQDCITYVGYVHLREVVEHDLNLLQMSWLYAQLKPQLDEHFDSIRIC